VLNLRRIARGAVCALALVSCKPSASGSRASAAARTSDAAEESFDASTESALTESAARLFRKQSPRIAVQVIGPLTLKLDVQGTDKHDLQVSLDRMWAVCQSDPGGCEGAMNDFVAKVVHTFAAPEEPATRDRVVAVVRPRAWFEAMGNVSDKERPMSDPLVDDLYVAYVVDLPEAVRSLNQKDLDGLQLPQAELPSLARANLTTRLGHVLDSLRTAGPGAVAVLDAGNYFESSRLLLADDWTALSSRQAQPIVVSVPASDVMIVAMGPGPAEMKKQRELTQAIYEKAQRPVSRRLFQWNAGSWAALQ
jgi:uncharacterized protein YtpQ (UPF0354 family)